jgi:hypothetical protein
VHTVERDIEQFSYCILGSPNAQQRECEEGAHRVAAGKRRVRSFQDRDGFLSSTEVCPFTG